MASHITVVLNAPIPRADQIAVERGCNTGKASIFPTPALEAVAD